MKKTDRKRVPKKCALLILMLTLLLSIAFAIWQFSRVDSQKNVIENTVKYASNPEEGDNVDSFSLAEYNYYIENFPLDRIVGFIDSSEDAIREAESIWIELFGEKVKKQRPYKVSFDEENQVWLVEGTLHQPDAYPNVVVLGGVAYLLIQKSDGRVLAVWHEG